MALLRIPLLAQVLQPSAGVFGLDLGTFSAAT